MHWRLALISFSLIIGTLLTLVFAYLGWTKRKATGASSFILMMCAIGVWSASYALEQYTPNLEEKIFWHKMAYLGIPYVPLCWFIFNAQILKFRFAAQRRWLVCLSIVPLAMSLLTWTMEYHPFVWGEFSILQFDTVTYLQLTRTNDFFFFVGYSYVLLLLGSLFFIRVMLQSPSLSINWILFLGVAIAMPLLFNVMRIVFEVDPFGPYDLTPLALTTTGVSAGWFVFRFGPLDVLSVAQGPLLENISDGYIVLNGSGAVVSINRAAQRMLNTTESSATGGMLPTLLPSTYRYQISDTGHQANHLFSGFGSNKEKVENPNPIQHEVSVIDPTGQQEEIYLDVSIFPLLDQRERQRGTLLVLRDISQRKRDQQALNQAQKLESMGLLAGGVAHDFNNLLASIKMRHQLAITSLHRAVDTAPEPAEQEESLFDAMLSGYESAVNGVAGDVPALPSRDALRHIEIADTAVERAADLTRQLLAFTGKGHFKIELVDLNQLVDENQAFMATAVPKEIELKIELSPLPLYVKADRGQLQQVVMNMLLNAVEATQGDCGPVTLETELCWIDEDEAETYLWKKEAVPGTYVSLSVLDSGIGMTPEVQARIFDPFFTTKKGGRGLGLSALLGAVHLYNGGIQVISKQGHGTRLRAILPYSNEQPVQAEPRFQQHRHNAPTSARASLLVADDEEQILMVLAEILQDCGYSVYTASNGREAVDVFLANQHDIDLALLDAKMPIMGGVDVLAMLRQSAPQLCALLSSGYSEQEISSAVHWDSKTDFIQKPYDPDDLLHKIEQMLRHQHSFGKLSRHI